MLERVERERTEEGSGFAGEEMEDLFKRESIIDRDVDGEELRGFLSRPNILTILGVRRCGKSMLSWMLLKDVKFGYVNFFDERLVGLEAKELGKLLEAFYQLYGTDLEFIVLDEVQYVSGWERFCEQDKGFEKGYRNWKQFTAAFQRASDASYWKAC